MKPLVLVHGFMGAAMQWDDLIQSLVGEREVLAVDLPGFGARNTSAAPESIGGFARDVLAHLDERSVGEFDLLGHSMGGMIVQEMVALAPKRVGRLVLYGTGPIGVMPGRFETIAESKRRVREDGATATARRIAATWFLHREAGPGYERCAEIAAQSSLQAMEAGLSAMEAWSGEERLHEIESPTLVLWGDGDRAYLWPQVEKLWTSIPGAGLAVVPGCSHAVHQEKPELFRAILSDFLK